jgi:hypothetical protein
MEFISLNFSYSLTMLTYYARIVMLYYGMERHEQWNYHLGKMYGIMDVCVCVCVRVISKPEDDQKSKVVYC